MPVRWRAVPAATAILLVPPAPAGAAPGVPPPAVLPQASVRDVEARGRMLDRGIPVSREAFSPDGFHFAYLHQVPGGFLRRKPQRCTFLLDLGTGENRPIRAPKGYAARVGGWDSTGRYLLVETHYPDLLSPLTGEWTTYHWIFDAVTSEFIPRRPFTGRRDGRRFLWKQRGTYHGLWSNLPDTKVWPLYEGELADIYHEREKALAHEDERRQGQAELLAVGSGGAPSRRLSEALPRLDAHWTRRGQRDPVLSDLFGERPALYAKRGGDWVQVAPEVEYVAVLDRGITLITRPRGLQAAFDPQRWEMLPLPDPPAGWAEVLQERWNRSGGFYDETDPLPRDLQYRRSYDSGQGTGYYFNYVTPDRSRILILYAFGPERRVLRVVDLPPAWWQDAPED